MSDIALDLLAIDRALDREIDRTTALFVDGLQATIGKTWQRDVLRVVEGLDLKGVAVSASSHNSRVARTADGTLRGALEVSGYGRHVNLSMAAMGEIAKISARGLRRAGLEGKLQPAAIDGLTTYRALKLTQFDRLAVQAAADIAGTIGRAIVARQSLPELVVEVREQVQAFILGARTQFETAAAEFAQTMTLLQTGGGGDRVYLYSGPIDLRIRRFCLGLAGQVLGREHIDRLDNRQLPNSFLTRGGYNCRHQWRDVSAIPELARLANSGRIVHDQIASQVSAMRGFLKVAGSRTGVRSA